MAEHVTDMSLIDGRRHLLGGQIIHAADGQLRKMLGFSPDVPLVIKLAKLTRKMGCNGTFYMQEAASKQENEAAMVLAGIMNDIQVRVAFVPEPACPADRNENSSHRHDDITADGEFSGSCRLSGVRPETFIYTLVDANRAIQLAAPPLAGRDIIAEFVYLENLSFTPSAVAAEFFVQVKNIASRYHDKRIFSLNELTFAAPDQAPQSCRIAFSFHEK